MVGRSVVKLFAESYHISASYSVSRSARGTKSACSSLRNYRRGSKRDLSICRKRLSKSSDGYKDIEPGRIFSPIHRRDEDYRSESAKKLISVQDEEEEENSQVYTIKDRTVYHEEPIYDVFNHLRNKEHHKSERGFLHLQPGCMKPYGSPSCQFACAPSIVPKNPYPIVTGKDVRKERYEEQQFEQAFEGKDYPGYEDNRKVSVLEKTSKHALISSKNFSTACIKSRPYFVTKHSKTTLSTNPVNAGCRTNLFSKTTSKTRIRQYFLTKYSKMSKTKLNQRNYNSMSGNTAAIPISQYFKYSVDSKNANAPKPNCPGYITVKLSELRDACNKQRKCKVKKISFGKLPALRPSDCVCVEDIPLKEGKPLLRLPARTVNEPKRKCPSDDKCKTPRADENYVIKKKSLPQIVMEECPCVETELVDYKIKRLRARKVPDPVRICPKAKKCEDAVRADANYQIKQKNLPKLVAGDCPCVELPELETVPLMRLKPKKVSYQRICVKEKMCDTPRADDNLVFKKKVLSPIKPLCKCIEAEPMKDCPPLKRLGKFKLPDPLRICPMEACEDTFRADANMTYKPKKLKAFKAQNCPCIEDFVPTKDVKMRRLPKKELPDRIPCPPPPCYKPPRADDTLIVKPKKLRQIKEVECPCVEEVMSEMKPLKRLVGKPVEEPKRPDPCPPTMACPPRADDDKKFEKKILPPVPVGKCPCVEAEPLQDAPPLAKLKKRPVKPGPPCPKVEKCTTPRADDSMKIKKKTLPAMPLTDCPCIEAPIPEDVKPLKRLKKKPVAEKPKVCPQEDLCKETHRSDEDDWMYWKRCTVKEMECPPCPPERIEPKRKPGNRDFSTCTNKNSTNLSLKYEVPKIANISRRPFSIYVDANNSNNHYTREMKKSDYEKVEEGTTAILRVSSKGSVAKHSSSMSRNISTTKLDSNAKKCTKDGPCECPSTETYLQPKNQVAPKIENFLIFPSERDVESALVKSRKYCRERPEEVDDCVDKCVEECIEECEGARCADSCESDKKKSCKFNVGGDCMAEELKPQLSLWERIVNYFKAKPDCPSPEEFRRMRLKEEAESAASKAGLCLYDPKEMLNKNDKGLPKVMTPKDCEAINQSKKC